MGVTLNILKEKRLEPMVPWEDIAYLLWHNDMLFGTITSNYDTSTACNGKICIWDNNFNSLGEFQAHDYGVYHMCAGPGNTIYTCASDSTICHWGFEKMTLPQEQNDGDDPPTGKVEAHRLSLLTGHMEPPWKLQYVNSRNLLFSGDELGEIRLWENDVFKGVLETYEEIWDMVVIPKFLFTVRNMDVTITSIPEDGRKKACSVKNTIPGRGPLFISHNKLLCLNRNNFDIKVHSITENGNPLIKTLTGHNALATVFVGSETIMFSGDYEGRILVWDLLELRQVTEIHLAGNGCVNAMAYEPVEKVIYIAQEKKSLTKLYINQD